MMANDPNKFAKVHELSEKYLLKDYEIFVDNVMKHLEIDEKHKICIFDSKHNCVKCGEKIPISICPSMTIIDANTKSDITSDLCINCFFFGCQKCHCVDIDDTYHVDLESGTSFCKTCFYFMVKK
jgi:hypothetical protein